MRFLMIRITTVAFCLGLITPVWAIEMPLAKQETRLQTESGTITASVKALMFYGEDKFQMHSQKPVSFITGQYFNSMSLVDLSPSDLAVKFSPDEETVQKSLGKAMRLQNNQILQPVLLSQWISFSPFVTLATGPLKAEKWFFEITDDSRKTMLFQKKGVASDLPDWLLWDGRNEKGLPVLEPGKKYQWQFRTEGPAPNKNVFQKEIFATKVLLYEQNRQKTVLLRFSQIFQPNSKVELSDAGKQIIKEIADLIRESGSEKIEIMVFQSEEKDSGPAWGLSLGRQLTKILLLNPEQVRYDMRKAEKELQGSAEIRF